MFPKSVVTRLLIFPTRLLALLEPASDDFPWGFVWLLLEVDLVLCASLPCPSCEPTRRVASVVWDGKETYLSGNASPDEEDSDEGSLDSDEDEELD